MKINKLPILIAIILIGIAPNADTYILIPAMAGIAGAFPDASPWMINMILTISSLFVIPTSLIVGKLAGDGKLNKKTALLIGFTLFTLGGAAGGLFQNLYYILFTRAIEGIGDGFATAILAGITADYYYGEERGNVLGIYNAVSSLLAIGLTLLGGYLAVINWRLAFAAYLLTGLIVIYHAIVLKKNPVKSAEALAEEEEERKTIAAAKANGQKPRLGKAVWALVVIVFASQLLGNVLYLCLDPFIEGEKLGNATSTSYAMSLLTIAIVLVSLLFGPIYGKCKRYTPVIFFIIMGAGFVRLAQSYSFGMALVAVVIWGLGYGLTVPYLYTEATVAPPKPLITFTGALINSAIFLSFYLSAFVPSVVALILHNDSVRSLYTFLGISMFVCGVLAAIYYTVNKGGKDSEQAA